MDEENNTQPTNDREARYSDFVGLLARHDHAVRCFVRSLMPSSDGIDDVMQETALECWNKFDAFMDGSDGAKATGVVRDTNREFVRWACVIARYKALSWQRDQSRDRLVFRESVLEQLSIDALSKIDDREHERTAVEACLGKMQDEQRRLVLSVHSPGESIARIAAETGQNARRLYSKVNVLRRQLFDCVQGQMRGEVQHG